MKFLKKMKNGNLRLEYFKFSNIPYLGNFTRIKSFIINDYLEIYCTTWHSMFLKIVNTLQRISPLELSFLLLTQSDVRNRNLFLNHPKSGYVATNYGLYIKDYGTSNGITWVIAKLISLYGFDPNACFMVVQTPPMFMDNKKQVIEEEKMKFCQLIKDEFVQSDFYIELCLNIVDVLNESLYGFSQTSYNNLYLLDLGDYDKYSSEAIKIQLGRGGNVYKEKELVKTVEVLKQARFYGNYLFNDEFIRGDGFYIEEDGLIVNVALATHYDKLIVSNESDGEDDE